MHERQPPGEGLGDPPFLLYCNYCRWDSAEAGITFDKPTGLAHQLQKIEDGLPDFLEFDRLKEHFEPLIRASSASLQSSTAHHAGTSTSHRSSATAAAASALARDVPGLRRPSGRTMSNPKPPGNNNGDIWENALYKSRLEASSGVGMTLENDIEWLRLMDEVNGLEEVADLEKRWLSSWTGSMRATELRPLRMPLHSKKTKRCYSCRHILIKPEQKAQSVRYKIKLMAANYLPSVEVLMPPSTLPLTSAALAATKSKDKTAEPDSTNIIMHQGKMYPFQLTLINPLYEPIQVRLTVHRSPPPTLPSSALSAPYRPPFGVTLPSAAFSISAFAEAWEYGDDDEMFDEDDLEEMLSPGGDATRKSAASPSKSKSSKANVGVLERKANTTTIGGEVLISREGSGEVKFNILVSYTYRADDAGAGDDLSPTKKDTGEGTKKTFSFFLLVTLGTIGPKDDGTTGSASVLRAPRRNPTLPSATT
ncbi:hypothetical protein FRB97_006216 [Tulasnella sp. 331]|nr:hypothetical protein FRB97_006216 [Tulasnella sp. 331]